VSRALEARFLQAINEGTVYPFFTVDLNFETTVEVTLDDDGNVEEETTTSAPLYLWTGNGNVTIEGIEYIGTGQFLEISLFEESTDIVAKNAILTLSGIPSDLLSLALQIPYQGRKAVVQFGVFTLGNVPQEQGTYVLNEDGGKLKLENTNKSRSIVFSGFMDTMSITEVGDTSQISLTIESRLVDLDRARVRRYTSEDQQSRFPGDLGFSFVNSIQDREIFWGRR